MRIIVAGGRVGIRREFVEKVLGRIFRYLTPSETTIVQGRAAQTDRYAERWAKDRGFKSDPVPIDNALDGDREDAPKRRNVRMLQKGADLVIGFPGGPGTRHMLEIAHEADVPVYDVELEGTHFIVWAWGKRGQKATRHLEGIA